MDSTQSKDESSLNIMTPPFVIGPGNSGPILDVNESSDEIKEEVTLKETVEQPAKVMRIGSMIKQLLDEVRQANLDEASRARLKEIYEISVSELKETLSPDLASELNRMSLPFGEDIPTEAELRVAQAQLVGWLEGLFHGIQAALFAQQMSARSQIEEIRGRSLSPGGQESQRPGTYL